MRHENTNKNGNVNEKLNYECARRFRFPYTCVYCPSVNLTDFQSEWIDALDMYPQLIHITYMYMCLYCLYLNDSQY